MLKRYQVLINEWLADFLKETAKIHNISFSEALRLTACLYIGETIAETHPEYKFPFNVKKISALLKSHEEGKVTETEFLKVLSQIYYESRKALEFSQEKRRAKKK